MVTEPHIEIDYDLVNQRYIFAIHHNGKSTATYTPYSWLGEGADPLAWERLIQFGWHARKMFDDEAQKPEGQPPSPA